MMTFLSLIRSPVLQIILALAFGVAGFWTYRAQVREQAKNEVVQKITTTEIQKLKNADKAQDRVRRDTMRKPDSLRNHNDGYRRD